jgi:hypothetical protein
MANRRHFSDLIGGEGRCPLAVSRGLLIYHAYEDAWVTDGSDHRIFGSLYGDPACAAIADDESWCAAGGAGIVIARVAAGETLFGAASRADVEFATGGAGGTLWVAALWASAPRQLGIVGTWGGEEAQRLWSLDVDTLALSRVGPQGNTAGP